MMVLGTVSALAAGTPDPLPTANTGKITINNVIKGETYKIYKLFDAEVGANGAIVYTGTIPTDPDLTTYFEKNSENHITAKTAAKDGDKLSTNAQVALQTWAAAQTSDNGHVTATGNTVVFDNLPFGYYVVTSTAKGSSGTSVIMVTSTDPQATIYEKNEKVPQPVKTVDDHDYSIGDTITYTVEFPGINFKGTGENAKTVTKYIVTDTLPPFLSNVTVTGISIGGVTQDVTDDNFPGVTTFGTNKTFDIPWAHKVYGTKTVPNDDYDENVPGSQPTKQVTDNEHWKWVSDYTNGSVVSITYTAVLTDLVNVGDKKNINTVTITRETGEDNEEGQPTDEEWEDTEYVYTYGAAIEKVDENNKPLAGAKFKVTGLTATETADGVYTVTAYRPTGDDAIALADSTEMEVDADGMLYIVGLDSALTLTITETEAPTGYNKLTSTVSLTTQAIGDAKLVKKIEGYRKYDNDGNLIYESVTQKEDETLPLTDADLSALEAVKLRVTNNKGAELPETGGIGTTIFYIGGSVLVLAAAILLITKRRMSNND